MSRIGNKIIEIPSGVTIEINGQVVTIKGKLGELSRTLPLGIFAKKEDNSVVVARESDSKRSKELHGTMRSLLANMVEGVSKGYVIELGIAGVGYRADIQGQKLTANVGFSHPVNYKVPDGVEVKVEGGTRVIVSGIDKHMVGQVAADIRGFWPADPYKAKGISYKGERIRRKAGKTVA